MLTDFRRSLRTLQTDSPHRSNSLLLTVVVLLCAWVAWFALARVSVFAVTGNARLEVEREKHPVGSAVAGRVLSTSLIVGRLVRAGDVLVELDATAEELARHEEQVRLAPAASQIESLREELAAQERALEQEQHSAHAGIEEGEARIRQSVAAARFARDESERMARLQATGLVSELEALRAANTAIERDAEARVAEHALSRLVREFEVRAQNRLAEMAGLKREIAALQGTREEALAASERIEFDIEQRIVRAPISGVIAEVSPLKPGSLVAPGDRVCTIVPDGEVRVVARFAPAAVLGRVKAGQMARVRLEAFPWTQYGSALAHVTSVAGELHDGEIRVELELERTETPAFPLQHGLPAEVNIEVERASPAALVLRSIGAYTRVAAMHR
jgi:membrane fusion protein (multidrug efflux system)